MIDERIRQALVAGLKDPPAAEAAFLARMAVTMIVLVPLGELGLLGCLLLR
jgi:hypothetical protein